MGAEHAITSTADGGSSLLFKNGIDMDLSRFSSELIQTLQSLHRGSSACVKINGAYTYWFAIRRDVRQGCVVSPWLFKLLMDDCLYDLLSNDERSVKCLRSADD
ncbi:hypothetical protein EVAR_45961_1 [Eumeta japonica]|uniref:Uncharacterized protein n=1 Tax=Eumeta variegata TaxID=151549 RepID=A0A4C1YPY3_EUMVA|nr:hypothetical protein EVAR_45961_1 [Eumeta japonica]